MEANKIIQGNCLEALKTLPDEIVDCCITSPPYFGLRDYGAEGQLGLEATPDEFVANLVNVFREVKRVLKKEGTVWLNLGDSYNAGRNGGHAGGAKQASLARHDGITRSGANIPGLKPKDLIGIPWKVAFALQADGWYLRQDIIWHKPNPMPESVTDRCTKAHEYIFLLTKSPKYYFDNEAIKEPSKNPQDDVRRLLRASSYSNRGQGGNAAFQQKNRNVESSGVLSGRNKRSVWTVTTKPFKEAHFATFPEDLIAPMVKAGCPEGGVVLDPFMGAGTTAVVAHKLGRKWLGIELNPDYIEIANKRLEPYIKQQVLI